MLGILSVTWDVDPILIHVGGFALRWYSLLFVSGFILGYYIFRSFFRREGIPEDKVIDPLLYTLLIATVVGARLGHCLFYQPDYYLGSLEGFVEIFMPWKGGLASHGGTIALIAAMWWFARRYGRKFNFDFLWLLDHLVIPVAFAGAFIRLGNLFNSEIFGHATTLPWGFEFPRSHEAASGVAYHPTQLYESLSYLVLGFILVGLYRKRLDKMYRGSFVGLFLVGCFGMRFLIEFVKNDQVGFEAGMALNMGQLLSIPFIVWGVYLLVHAYRGKKPAKRV